MTTTTKTKKAKPDFITNPLNVLYSARMRLTAEQRETLREAHRAFRLGFQKEAQQNVLAGSTLAVSTAYAPPSDSYSAFGLSDIVVQDLIGTRDSVSLTTILQLQRLLKVEVITREELVEKFNNYLDFILE